MKTIIKLLNGLSVLAFFALFGVSDDINTQIVYTITCGVVLYISYGLAHRLETKTKED